MFHVDLFSGIGGFALAVDEVFGSITHVFCEIDKYCQALLKKRFDGSLIYGDIRTLSFERFIADTNRNGQPRRSEEVNTAETKQQAFDDAKGCFILTGGFPCQPFSQAGKRKGTDDNRYLWHEMFRVIQDFKPTWVIAENVRGLLTIEQGMVFEQVCLDLEGEGYEVQPFVIPAVAVNAPHRRDRVWFVANRNSDEHRANRGQIRETERIQKKHREKMGCWRVDGTDIHAPDTRCECRKQGNSEGMETNTTERTACTIDAERFNKREWEENWLDVAFRTCVRGVDDGLPAELDGLKLSKAKHRVERLKALGNAIVPQVAVEIMKGIQNSEEVK